MMSLKTLVLVITLKTCFVNSVISANNTGETLMDFNSFASDVWTEGIDVARVLWKDCSKLLSHKNKTNINHEHFSILVKCAKKKTLNALDRSLSSDVISLGSGIQLVKYEKVGRDGHVKKQPDRQHNDTVREFVEKLYENGDWRYMVLNKMANVFKTHVLKLDIQENNNIEIEESRHRRRHHMMQMMMFGVTSMGMILVPMGFQFLAVLGGKALLLAKLALILSSIQGLKKIATSPLSYGLYHSYPPSFEGHVEKRGYDQEWSKHPPIIKPEESTEAAVKSEKIKYRYDSDSRLWKPEIKRSYYNPQNAPVYPVYPVSPHEITYPSYLPSEQYEEPTEIHAEYTIDLPVNKVQFKSNAPFIQ